MMKSDKILENMKSVTKSAADYCRRKVNRRLAFKTLLGLCVLGVCAKVYPSCKNAVHQTAKRMEQQKAVPATLISKEIYASDGGRYVDLYLDMDGNPSTAEAVAKSNSLSGEKMIKVYNLTNGTTKTIGEWEKITGWSTIRYGR